MPATRTETEPTVAASADTDATARLNDLKKKIRAAMNKEAGVDPSDKPPSCRACYTRGWMAALKVVLRED
jgi:hypothetical protein